MSRSSELAKLTTTDKYYLVKYLNEAVESGWRPEIYVQSLFDELVAKCNQIEGNIQSERGY